MFLRPTSCNSLFVIRLGSTLTIVALIPAVRIVTIPAMIAAAPTATIPVTTAGVPTGMFLFFMTAAAPTTTARGNKILLLHCETISF